MDAIVTIGTAAAVIGAVAAVLTLVVIVGFRHRDRVDLRIESARINRESYELAIRNRGGSAGRVTIRWTPGSGCAGEVAQNGVIIVPARSEQRVSMSRLLMRLNCPGGASSLELVDVDEHRWPPFAIPQADREWLLEGPVPR